MCVFGFCADFLMDQRPAIFMNWCVDDRQHYCFQVPNAREHMSRKVCLFHGMEDGEVEAYEKHYNLLLACMVLLMNASGRSEVDEAALRQRHRTICTSMLSDDLPVLPVPEQNEAIARLCAARRTAKRRRRRGYLCTGAEAWVPAMALASGSSAREMRAMRLPEAPRRAAGHPCAARVACRPRCRDRIRRQPSATGLGR